MLLKNNVENNPADKEQASCNFKYIYSFANRLTCRQPDTADLVSHNVPATMRRRAHQGLTDG
jgi:hypothetical protein